MSKTFALNNSINNDVILYGPLSGTRNRATPGDYDKYMKNHKFDNSILSIKQEKYNFFKDILYIPLFFVPQLVMFSVYFLLTSIF